MHFLFQKKGLKSWIALIVSLIPGAVPRDGRADDEEAAPTSPGATSRRGAGEADQDVARLQLRRGGVQDNLVLCAVQLLEQAAVYGEEAKLNISNDISILLLPGEAAH